jgi:predicted phage terminase large subunit-like protein
VHLPAEAFRDDDPLGRAIGERLWPEWFGPDHFTAAKTNPRTWSALYQGRPSPEEGEYFRSEWLRPYERHPALETLTLYGASDFAVSEGRGDYTCHIIIGVDPRGDLWLLDVWRQQVSPERWVEAFCRMVKQYRPKHIFVWAMEAGQIAKSIGPYLKSEMIRNHAYVERKEFASSHDKTVRAQSIRGMMATVGLHVQINAPWYSEFRSEILAFPAGRHDDQVDCLSLIGRLLDKLAKGREAKPEPMPAMTLANQYGQVQVNQDRRQRRHARAQERI